MAWSGKTYNLPYVREYEDAKGLFEKTSQPRGKDWWPHERPLGDNSKHHYRLVLGDGRYDVMLYSTPMARYYAPDEAGKRVVCYHGHDGTTTSKDFRWHVLQIGLCEDYFTPDNRRVAVPIAGGHGVSYDGYNDWAAKLTFNASNQLIVEESDHRQMYRSVSSEEDRQRRAQVRERLADITTLMAMRLPQFKEAAEIDYRAGRPFGTAVKGYKPYDISVRIIVLEPDKAEPSDYTLFEQFAQDVFDTLVSKRAYRRRESSEEIVRSVTEEEFMAALTRKAMDVANMNRKTGRALLPKFMDWDEFPASNKHYT